MPNIKSAEKRVRAAGKRRVRNKAIRSLTRTSVNKAEKLIFSGEKEGARAAVAAAVSTLDRAARKGIIHANNAARRKSRLVKKLNRAEAPPPVEEPEAE